MKILRELSHTWSITLKKISDQKEMIESTLGRISSLEDRINEIETKLEENKNDGLSHSTKNRSSKKG